MKDKGRPTKYKPEYAIQAEKLCKKGFIDREIADFFGIAESTLNLWKHANPDFMESLKKGKSYCDDAVVDSLYKRAIGSEYTEEKIETKEGEPEKTTRTKRIILGDTTAQIFWLKNRQPEEWREKSTSDVNLKVEKPLSELLEDGSKE